MPAIPLFVQILLGLLFSPAIIKSILGAASAATGAVDASTTPVTGSVHQVVPATTAGSQPEASPTTAQIVNEAVKRPANWFGLALFGGALVFVIAQTRAAAHEAGGALADTYKEAKSTAQAAHSGLSNADGSTGNISRRLKN